MESSRREILLLVQQGNPEGVIAVRFIDPASSDACIEVLFFHNASNLAFIFLSTIISLSYLISGFSVEDSSNVNISMESPITRFTAV